MKFLSRTTPRLIVAIVAFLAIPSTLISAFLLIQNEFAEVRALRATTEATLITRDELEDLLIAHIDSEAAVRGYVVSRDESFLQPYEVASRDREKLFAQLSDHLDTELQPELAILRRLSDERWAILEANVRDVRNGSPVDAERRIASGKGRQLMLELRQEIAALDDVELAKVRSLAAAGVGSRNFVERTVEGLFILLAVLLVAVAFVTRRTMNARREALARAHRLALRQKAMFEGAVDPMLLLDAEGRILRMNPSVERMFGFSEDELLGKHNMVLMADDFTAAQSQAWLATIREAGAHGAGKRQEFTGLRKDGTTFETEVAISRFISNGERQYVAAIRDITDRKRAEIMKTEFVSTVSHELRTPLTSISGSLGLLSAGAVGELNERALRLVSIAHSNCERLIRLINDILDIEKIESGKMQFDLRRMQVAPLIRGTTSAMNGFAQKHGVELMVQLPPWPQCIVGDPDRLEQLLTNLVSNAIKHSPEGERVELSARQDGSNIRIEVRDRGHGVPLGFREKIFGKFAMADASDSRSKGGTGLGLSIVREIARRHGGDVGYSDRPGGGTIFHVDLPMVADEPVPNRRDAVLRDKVRILHVDDDMDCLNVVASAFADRATVVSAGSVPQATELGVSERFDAAIIDVDVKPDSGLELIPLLRERNPEIAIFLFTALDENYADISADLVLVKSRTSVADMVDAVLTSLDEPNRRVA